MLKTIGTLVGILTLSISCAEQQSSWQKLSTTHTPALQDEGLQLFSQNQIEVVDQKGQPVPNASVLIGFENGNPFLGNVVTTDVNGSAGVPADWKAALPVTVQAPGYVTKTLPVALPGDHRIQLSTQELPSEIEISGQSTDFGRLTKDGKVDFGLVIPALSRDNLLAFDLSTVMSPRVDVISLLGYELKIPSNLTLPKQVENYIFPVEFNKPNYRSYVRNKGQYLMSTTHGRFPLTQVVNDIRAGKSIFEVVNHFEFLQGGQRTIDVQGNTPGINLAVNQFSYNNVVNVRAPSFPSGQVMLSLGVVQKDGLLMPSDLKRLSPGQNLNLKTNSTAGLPYVFSVLVEETAALVNPLGEWFAPFDIKPPATVKADFSKFTFALLPASGGVAPEFLPIVAKPSIADNVVTLQKPALPAGLTAVATYLVLIDSEQISEGSVAVERRTRLWEVWSNAWLEQVELPKIELNRQPGHKYRWEVMFMARPANFVAPSSQDDIDLNSVTHVTRNSIEI